MNNLRIGILTIVKDEQDYLEEWLSYHEALGINRFYIYEDIGSTSHSSICSSHSGCTLDSVLSLYETHRHNDITTRRLAKVPLQRCYQRQAINKLLVSNEVDWLFIMDVDEFLTPLSSSLQDTLARYDSFVGLSILWQNYNACGHIHKPQGGVQENFTERCGNIAFDINWKCIGKVALHLPRCSERTFYTHHRFPDEVTNVVEVSDIVLRHYITRSWDEYVWKTLVRGMCHPNHRKLEQFFQYNPSMVPLEDELLKSLPETLSPMLEYDVPPSGRKSLRGQILTS